MDSRTTAIAKLTAMHAAHRELGAEFVYRDGWKLPGHYSGVEEEVARVKGAGGIFDISPVGKLSFQGADVLAGVATALALPEPLAIGKSVKCACPTASEDSRESVTVAALTYDEAMVITSAGARESVAGALEEQLAGCGHMIDLSSAWAGIGAVGPRVGDALARIVELDLDPERFLNGACAQAKTAEVHGLILRGDVSGELGFQVYVTRDYGEYVWDALVHGGRGVGVGPVGIDAFEQIAGDSSGIPW